MQPWLARASSGADEAATALCTGAFQLTISLATLFGGVLIDRLSAAVLMLAGGVVAAMAAVVVGLLGSWR